MNTPYPHYYLVGDVYVKVEVNEQTKTMYATGQTGNPYDLGYAIWQGSMITKEQYDAGMAEFRASMEKVKPNPNAVDKILTS